MKHFIIYILVFVFSNASFAHKDSPLQIDQNGNLTGLPIEKFSTANFSFKEKSLRINNLQVKLPECVKAYFHKLEDPNVYIFASWYHSEKYIPHYIGFEISNPNSNYKYTILIALNTLELLKVEESIKEGNGYYLNVLELEDQCISDYNKNIKYLD